MTDSQMRREIAETPEAVARLLTEGGIALASAARAMAARDPAVVMTVARGSSDHVCTFFKYACELTVGVPVASVGPSVASVYGAQLKLDGQAALAISQSGQSPDIVALAKAAGAAGALSLALTNDARAPLTQVVDYALGIYAGPETSVAATKTFVASAVAVLMLLAEWRGDAALRTAIRGLPDKLAQAVEIDWPELRAAMSGQGSAYVLGRGPGWAIANEVALKFKEVTQIHAESYSSAEVLHGPVSLVAPGFPVLVLAAEDAAEPGLRETAATLAGKGAACFLTGGTGEEGALPLQRVRTGHPLTDPLALVVSAYAMVERLATERGINPDSPRHLAKVTETR